MFTSVIVLGLDWELLNGVERSNFAGSSNWFDGYSQHSCHTVYETKVQGSADMLYLPPFIGIRVKRA
jgi:hypothetical protein